MRKSLVGLKFNSLTVLSFHSLCSSGRPKWLCMCDCGNIKAITQRYLKNGKSKSCGCLQKRIVSENKTIHGFSKTRFYGIWKGVVKRCLNKNSKSYLDYGGRGITVCDRWLKFENFKEDMYDSYLKHVDDFGEKDTSIDRVNNNGNYIKENCRWATQKEQRNNQRLSINNKTFMAVSPIKKYYLSRNQRGFATKHKLSSECINSCLRGKNKTHKGWTFKYVTIISGNIPKQTIIYKNKVLKTYKELK